ncbi:glycogen debranching N-terminal domain-containing protein [Compostimonas suwonensis]|uniref:Glycogen debranching enzyme n=1 Tax=Compostimonas suwonensis TaxID=1048394 RepID=A0A2M9C4P8_9MICO|nr:glycogen debranching N-terminal domain-containing protein [Compostimonas suwonensis]PJJ65504.1 glycogen debranching enzyme [Compostimonas suwonensis]
MSTASDPLQPLLHDDVVVLLAPTQVWSAADGTIGGRPVHGVYHGDTRVLSAAEVLVAGIRPEALTHTLDGASTAVFTALARTIDGPGADPGVRVERRRTVGEGALAETITISSALDTDVATSVALELRPDATSMHLVKAGLSAPLNGADPLGIERTADGISYSHHGVEVTIGLPDAVVAVSPHGATSARWSVTVPAHGTVTVGWSLAATDATAVVHAAPASDRGAVILTTGDSRLSAWVERALDDLDALRLVTTTQPDEPFLAAGAPWFFTLFGRDSIWAARFLLPLGTELAAGTLRVLASMQGTTTDAATAEQPGKIMHELRPGVLTIPGENITLPPLYYGTVDATALWIVLLHDAWRWGMPDDEVRALLPHLEAALAWMRDYGDSDGDGFLEYIDTTGHGLANQGWKDSGDSIQWRDGRLAEGPIALCEVQAYAHEAAIDGAALLEHFGRPGASEWRSWAAELKRRFNESFWIADPAGDYPAVALDARKQRVDTVTSNLGHLLGTGILSDQGAALVAARLVSPELDSGYGLRTMSTDSAGYWPLSYHGGSVWTHDTAIAIAGLGRDGFEREAGVLAEGLLAAASGFDYRMPELHSGDARALFAAPVPYPAACRPQAWSAAAAVSVLSTVLGLAPDHRAGVLDIAPIEPRVAGAVHVDGLSFRGTRFGVTVADDGSLTHTL